MQLHTFVLASGKQFFKLACLADKTITTRMANLPNHTILESLVFVEPEHSNFPRTIPKFDLSLRPSNTEPMDWYIHNWKGHGGFEETEEVAK